MSTNPQSSAELISRHVRLMLDGGRAHDLNQALPALALLRAQANGASVEIDGYLLSRIRQAEEGLGKASEIQAKLRKEIEALTDPPWPSAVYLARHGGEAERRAIVLTGELRTVVRLAEGFDPSGLAAGDTVFLDSKRAAVVGALPPAGGAPGRTAVFERRTADGRLVLRSGGDEVVVACGGRLDPASLAAGDPVVWSREAWLALERIDRAGAKRFVVEEVEDVGPEAVGGQDRALSALLAALTARLVAPDRARAYGLSGSTSILLWGPPGCGKTLMARVAAAQIRRKSGERCAFSVVKPSEWEDPYVGVTQQNIRNLFQGLREAARDGYAVLFLDEIESVGRIRGASASHHSDKFLAALLAELQGFHGLERVALIAATNRKDLIDPALLERISAVEIPVGRPDRRAAEAILGIHLPASLPFSPNGKEAAATRARMIELASSRLYAPNGESAIYRLRFRDGKERRVAARELASGRVLEQVCHAVRQAAFVRELEGGEPGLAIADMDLAIEDALDRMGSMLSPVNAHVHIIDLPHDVDVVAAEPLRRRTRSRPVIRWE